LFEPAGLPVVPCSARTQESTPPTSTCRTLSSPRVSPEIIEMRKLCVHAHAQTSPGVDVMITIFGDFCQFSAKKWLFSQKRMLLSIFSKISSSLSNKRQYFRQITSAPDQQFIQPLSLKLGPGLSLHT
jgi:hypothetical protein